MMSNPDEYLQLDNQVCFALYSASNAMSRAYQPLLKAVDLTYLQYIVMMVLWEQKEINVKALGSKTHLDSGTLTPLLKRLETKGYVQRSRSIEDERVRVITLTSTGTKLKDLVQKVPVEMLCLSKMNEEELTSLKMLCEQLLGNLTK